jgi:hypothetical protein
MRKTILVIIIGGLLSLNLFALFRISDFYAEYQVNRLQDRMDANLPRPQRYQMVMHPEFPGKFTYLVDTQTGAIWQSRRATYREGDPAIWFQEEFEEPLLPSSAEKPMGTEWVDILYPQKKEQKKKK